MTISFPAVEGLSSKEQELLQDRNATSSKHSNPDAIDYTPAFRREYKRRQQLDEYFKLNNLEHFNQPIILNSELSEKQPAITFDDPVFQKNAYFDVLPSFEMYHSLQYHNPSHVESDTPPGYTPSLVSSDSVDLLNGVATESSLAATDSNIQTHSTGRSASLRPSLSTTTTQYFDKNMVDNYHTLPTTDNKGISISISVTKNLPGPHTKNENESILKEYTSGDIVHGYAVIQNTSSKEIPFRSFFVTLEGINTVIDTQTKCMIKKKFLMMVDLSATWSDSTISSSAVNQEFVSGSYDSVDGCYFGLPDDRILKPGMKHKKFFTFKFPYNVLDDKCRHDQNLHLLLPPSLGFNKLYKNGKYANIPIDPVLKYGYKSVPGGGGPVVVDDMTNDLVSINYSINAFFLDDEAPECKGRLTLIKHKEHFLRFLPFGFAESLFSSKLILSNFKSVIEMNLRNCQNFLEGDVKPKQSITEHSYSTESIARSCSHNQTDKSNAGPIQFPIRNVNTVPTEITRHITYQSKSSSAVFGFAKSNSSKQATRGALTITTNVPKDGIPYIAPTLIQKINKKGNLNTKGNENINNLLDVLEVNEKKIIDEINLDLNFETSLNGSQSASLPELKDVNVELLVLNIYSTGSIPIKLSQDIFLDQDESGDLLAAFKSQFDPYIKQYKEYQEQFDTLEVPISSQFDKNIYKDLLSIKDMRYDSFTISNLFQTKPLSKQKQWSQTSSNQYSKQIKVKFDLNQDRIKETLIPTFQSCLLSRAYFIKIGLTFKDGFKTSVKIPVRVRKLDDHFYF